MALFLDMLDCFVLFFIATLLQTELPAYVYFVRSLAIADYRQRVSMQCQRIYIQRVGVCVGLKSLTVSRFLLAS